MLTLPHYRVQETIHQGTRSVLYRAYGEREGRSVLLKALATRAPSSAEMAALEREHEIARELALPGVVRHLALVPFQDGESTCLVLEDFGGRTLADVLTDGPLDLVPFLAAAEALARAVGELHDSHVIHRDIHPASILYDARSGQIRIADLGKASFLAREQHEPRDPGALADALPYVAPEQTGRMNRAVDSRSDLYSLGAVFYQMVTGVVPFEAPDPMGLVQCHLAQAPVPPDRRRGSIPAAVSTIVLRLMAKEAADRYQSARGLAADLADCARRLRAGERLDPFTLGEHDTRPTFQVPEDPFPSPEHVATLTAALGRAAEGPCELVVIAGPSGAGKSMLAHEIVRPLAARRGYFACGECDPGSVDAPLSALTRAFGFLLRQIVSESAERREQWKTKLLSALDGSGQILTDLVPEALQLLGAQPPVIDLPPAEAQDRIERALRGSLLVFAAPEHPLVLFLDGLQWIDPASSRQWSWLAADPASAHLLLLGAYRRDKGSPEHPVVRAVEHLAERSVTVTRIDLEAPGFGGGADLAGRMAAMIRTYPEATQDLLTLASSLGNGFDLSTLAILAARSPRETAAGLWAAIKDGLVLPLDDQYQDYQWSEEDHDDAPAPEQVRYRFVHDRIREAAYARIDADRRDEVSLGIGRLLLEEIPPERRWARIFELVNALSLGGPGTSREEMHELAGLCLIAARRAKASAAPDAAAKYLAKGIDLLPEGAWKSHYDRMFDLHRERMECDYLCGDLARAKETFRIASKEARTTDHLGAIHQGMIRIARAGGEIAEGMRIGREGLLLLGVQLPVDSAQVGAEIARKAREIIGLIAGRDVLSLIDAPPLQDREIAVCLTLLHETWACAVRAADFSQVVLIASEMIVLSLKHGPSEVSACGYAAYGAALSIQGNHSKAHSFGVLARLLSKKFESPAVIPAVNNTFATFINHFTAHARESLPIYEESYRCAVQTGDRWWGARAVSWIRTTQLLTGRPLPDVHATGIRYHDYVRDSGYPPLYRALQIEQRLVLELQGMGEGPPGRAGWSEEDASLAALDEQTFGWGTYWHCVLRGFVLFLFEEHAPALRWIREADARKDVAPSAPTYPDCFFYGALILAANHPSTPADEQDALLAAMRVQEETIRGWATRCPENFRHRYLLVSAEVARIAGNDAAAADRYDEAIEAARQSGYLHHEAIANELCGNHYLARRRPKAAKGYLMEARALYTQWGATAKVSLLDARHGELLAGPAAPGLPSEDRTREIAAKDEELAAALIELKDTQERMLDQSRLAFLGSLTAGIAHDLRNPLTFVTNFAELSIELADEISGALARVGDRLDPETVSHLDEVRGDLTSNLVKIAQHGGRAARMIRSMLEQYREGTGEREDTDLNVLLRAYVELAFQGRRLRDPAFDTVVDLELDPSIGTVSMVPQEISRVFLNLIDNACYAANARRRAPGGQDHVPRVLVKTRDLGRRMEVRIRDNGLGVSDTIRERIFDPFFTTKPVGEGTGLGLSMSHEIIVKRNGGTLRLESEEGQFTELIVTLPKRWTPPAPPSSGGASGPR